MSSTFSNLKFELIGNGEQSGVWGTTTNANIGTAIEQAIVGMATLDSGDFVANVCTLTLTNTNAAQDARALCLNIDAGAVSAAGTINVPAIQKPYLVINGSSYTVTVKVSGLTGVAVPAGTRTVVFNNGTDVGTQLNWLNSLTLGTALPVASGGTGVTAPGTAGNVLTSNGTAWVSSALTPSGSNTQVQFNNAGAFGASSNFTFNSGTFRLSLGGSLGIGPVNTDGFGMGSQFLTYASGDRNIAIGTQVLEGNVSPPNTGVENIGLGYQVAQGGSLSGSYNIFIGSGAGQNVSGTSYNTYIGYQTGRFPSTTATGTNNTALGNGAKPATELVSNTITLGNSSIATLRCQVTTITSLSDQRDKTDVSLIGDALNLIRNITPVRFVWNMRDGGKVGQADTGFIAQQLLEAQQASAMHIPGLVDETNPDKLEAGYGKLIPVLVKALQQLDAEFQAYKLSHP